MYNNIDRGPVANVVALHYFEEDTVDPKGLFYFIENWIEVNDLTPTKMGGQGDKNITFSRGKKSLEKRNFQGIKEQGIWIGALFSEDKIRTEGFDFLMVGKINYEGDFKERSCVFCWDDQIIPWENYYIKKLVKDLCLFLKPQYGYAFQREFKKGPGTYPWGTEVGKISDQESKEIMYWGNVGLGPTHSKYQSYMQRDVYPLNFLSPQHLEAIIGSQTLHQWILDDPSRGTLEELLPNFWSWAVDSSNLDKVKTELIPNDLLIAHMNF